MKEQIQPVAEMPAIEYSLNLARATFSVSKLAHESYGLTLFRSEKLQDGDSSDFPDLGNYRVDALLGVRGELNIPDIPVMDDYLTSQSSGQGLTVITAFGGDRTSMTESLIADTLTALAEGLDMDVDEIRDHIFDDNGSP